MEQQQQTEIAELVKRFTGLQATLRLGNRAFAARYRKYLQSEKTWRLLRDNAWHGHIKPERALERLRGLARHVDAASAFDADDFMTELPFVKRFLAEVERLLGSPGDRRCMVVLAPEGVGKSWAASYLVGEDVEHRIYVRAPHTWRDKSLHIMRGLCEKLDAPTFRNPTAQFEALKAKLNERPVMIILDEAHNTGVVGMKLIKDLIDETPTRFVYAAFPTEFDLVRSVNAGAVAEARQFLRRCIRPVFDDYRTGISVPDVLAYLTKSGFEKSRDARTLAEQITPILARNHNLSTLADAVAQARDEADDTGTEMTLLMVANAVRSLVSTAADRSAPVGKEAA